MPPRDINNNTALGYSSIGRPRDGSKLCVPQGSRTTPQLGSSFYRGDARRADSEETVDHFRRNSDRAGKPHLDSGMAKGTPG